MTLLSNSSLVTKPYRHILASQANFSENPELALESLLTSYGIPQASLFTEYFIGYIKGNYLALLKLLTLLDNLGIAQVSSWLQLVLGEPYEQVKRDLQYVLPFTAEIDFKATFDVVVQTGLVSLPTGLFGYQNFNPAELYNPGYLLTWAYTVEPSLQAELSYLQKDNLLFFLVTYINRVAKTDLLRSRSAVKKLSSCLSRTLALQALGDDPTQYLYFPYVSTISSNS